MPIDSNIALGVKPIQLESPINQMSNVYALQNAAQSNQLNQMKMEEYKRGLAESEAFKRNMLGVDANTPEGQQSIYNNLLRTGRIDDATKFAKNIVETKNLGLTGQETQGKINKQKMEQRQATLRDTSRNPSDANLTAHVEDILLSPLYSAEEKAASSRMLTQLLAMPIPERQAFLASQGATASDLKPNIQMQNIGGSSNVLSVPAYGGAPTTLSSTKMTASPGEIMTAATAKAGQDITKRGQDLTNARELEKIAIDKGKNSPEYIAMKSKMEEQGKGQAKFEATAPQAITTAEQMLTKIDDMVGKPAKLNAKGQVVEKGTAAHPGFKGAVGKSSMYPLIPGTDAANFQARLDEIKGGAFLEAYNTLRGGGSITQIEGDKATAARTRMSTAQSEEEFIAAARDYQNIIRAGIKDAKEKLAKGTTANTNVDALLEKYK
jgi:hypothetical protein